MRVRSILMALLAIASVAVSVRAEIVAGSFGQHLSYRLDTQSGLLVIEGAGQMDACRIMYEGSVGFSSAPWGKYFESIRQVEVKDGVSSIGNYAFANCKNMCSISMPESVVSIGEGAFWGCSGLTAVSLPASLVSIGYEAFFDCNGIESVVIPNNVVSIDKSFECCGGLKELTIPSSVTRISEWSFSGCYKLESLIWGSSADIRVVTQSVRTSLKKVVVTDGVTRLIDNAFANCTLLSSVSLPASLTLIGQRSFEGCRGLRQLFCEAVTPPRLESDVFYNLPQTSMVLYVPAQSVDAYTAKPQWRDFGSIEALDDGIERVGASKDSPIYDISGRRIEMLRKGLFIQDGRKVLR